MDRKSWRLAAGMFAIVMAMTACDEPSGGEGDAGSGDAGGGSDAGGGDAGGDAGTDGGAPSALDTFEDDVAQAQCDALFRCCDAASVEEFFSQYTCFPGLPCPFESFQDRLPPMDTVEESECVPLMRELNAVAPFPIWLEEARAGRMGFDETAHQACLDALSSASCGDEVRAALYDVACFARIGGGDPTAPATIDHVSFERTAAAGEACVTIPEDPFGSCDPELAFCCVRASEDEPCSTGGDGEAGTCVAVGGLGDECTSFPPQPCAPGLRCPPPPGIEDPSFCAEPNTTPIANGEQCMVSFEPIGVCTDGYCDFTTELCAARKALGEACNVDDECLSGECAGTPDGFTCEEPTFCVGA